MGSISCEVPCELTALSSERERERASFMYSLTHLLTTHLLLEDGKPLPLHRLHSSPHQARPVSAVSNLPATSPRHTK